MSDLTPILIVAAAVAVAAVALLMRTLAVRGNLRALAQDHGGRFESKGRLWGGDAVFAVRGAEVRVRDGRSAEWRDLRRVVMTFSGGADSRLALTVRPRGWWSRLWVSIPRQAAADAEFARRFRVESADEIRAAAALVPGVRAAILRLSDLCGRRSLTVTLSGPCLEISASGSAYFPSDLRCLVGAAVTLHRRLAASLAELDPPGAIRILHVADPAASPGDDHDVADPPVCPVCRDPLGVRMVLCRACRTPHHADCWKYTGGCAVYACRGKSYLRAG